MPKARLAFEGALQDLVHQTAVLVLHLFGVHRLTADERRVALGRLEEFIEALYNAEDDDVQTP